MSNIFLLSSPSTRMGGHVVFLTQMWQALGSFQLRFESYCTAKHNITREVLLFISDELIKTPFELIIAPLELI